MPFTNVSNGKALVRFHRVEDILVQPFQQVEFDVIHLFGVGYAELVDEHTAVRTGLELRLHIARRVVTTLHAVSPW